MTIETVVSMHLYYEYLCKTSNKCILIFIVWWFSQKLDLYQIVFKINMEKQNNIKMSLYFIITSCMKLSYMYSTVTNGLLHNVEFKLNQ